MINTELLQNVQHQLQNKEAYVPPAAAAGSGVPMTDPAMAAAAGAPPAAPPMDPAQAGGAPPAPPPMDPSMMGAGGMPMDPSMMDPSMMGAGGMPMDPSMMDPAAMGAAGILPPMDPAAMGEMPPEEAPPAEGETVQVSMEDLRAIFKEGAGEGADKEEDGSELEERISSLEDMLGTIMDAMNLGIPGTKTGEPEEEPMPEVTPSPEAAEALPEDFSLLEDVEIPERPPEQPVKEASEDEVVAKLRKYLQNGV